MTKHQAVQRPSLGCLGGSGQGDGGGHRLTTRAAGEDCTRQLPKAAQADQIEWLQTVACVPGN